MDALSLSLSLSLSQFTPTAVNTDLLSLSDILVNVSEVVIRLNLHRNISYRQKVRCRQRPAPRHDAKGVVCIKLSDVVIQCQYK